MLTNRLQYLYTAILKNTVINKLEDYKNIFEAMPGVSSLLAIDAPGFTILAVTDGVLEVTGMTREQLCGNKLFDLFPEHNRANVVTNEETVRSSLEYVMTHKTPHRLERLRYDIPGINGSFKTKYWEEENKPVLNNQGELLYILHSVKDITDQKQVLHANEAIRTGEAAHHLFMQAPMAICIIKGQDLVIELANARVLEIWRKTPSVIGKPLLVALPEVEGTLFPDLLHRVRTSGVAHHANESHAYFIKDGKEELVYFNFVYQPYYEDGNENATGVLVVAHEVTDLVKARKIVEESEERYRTLIANAIVATGVYAGREMRIQYANDAMIKVWGKDSSVIGKTIREALPELEGQPFHEILDKVYSTGETYWGKQDKVELEVDDQLQTFYFNFTYKALKDAEGTIYGILNMAIDVTEQVLTQQRLKDNHANLEQLVQERTRQLAQKNAELEYSNREFEQFAYIASHDLQEPLRKIRTFSEIISEQVEEGAGLKKYVDKINASAARMSGLINSLLDYSKLAKGGVRFEMMSLNTVLQDILSDYELLITQKDAIVEYEELPTIEAVPLQINQLFYNLLGNALKFTRRNVQPVIKITCVLLSDEEYAGFTFLDSGKPHYKITFKDNGIGFEQGYADKIFTIFQRLNDRSQYGGYGIGLALCKKVVDAHKGIIFANGSLLEGASFTSIFPKYQ